MEHPAHDVASTISRFANCFDLKDWPGLEEVLAEQVEVDYAHLRGERETLSRSDYVARRRDALASLDTHHLLANAEIEFRGDSATCRVSGLIQRRREKRHFHSHVVYTFRLEHCPTGWRITSIAQRVLWNEGDASIHSGAGRAGSAGGTPGR